jgi:DNA-binding CsgD family transcriptional regulator
MSKHAQITVLQRVIGAIGEPDFAAVAARSVLDWLDFDLTTVVVHRRDHPPGLMCDNFDAAGARQGVRNYVAVTHRLNPMLGRLSGPGVFRARDYRIAMRGVGDSLRPYLIESPDEELGYRTVGWPKRLEEIGLYFEAGTDLVELGIYRERGTQWLSAVRLHELSALCMPLSAAFDRQFHLVGHAPGRCAEQPLACLSRRQREVAQLLLLGCGSEAIALRLGIGLYTVKDHRKQIFRKLGIGTLAELFALHRKLDQIAAYPL